MQYESRITDRMHGFISFLLKIFIITKLLQFIAKCVGVQWYNARLPHGWPGFDSSPVHFARSFIVVLTAH